MSDGEKGALLELARQVDDPVLFHTIGELELLGDLEAGKSGVDVTIKLPITEYPGEQDIIDGLTAALSNNGSTVVRVHPVVMSDEEREALGERLRTLSAGNETSHDGHSHGGGDARENQFANRRSVTRVIGISSGKGGVGKSSVTVNLAVALARRGHSVGLLDADIYGFSVPRMIGVPYAPIVLGKSIVPPVAHGVRCISMGFFVDEDQAVAWRGPMLHKALEQFLNDVHWGTPEFLVIDMPPGTGDIALSIAQQLPTSEVYVVTTPQPGAGRVAQRSAALGKQLRLSIRGVIENMSFFAAPDGNRYEIFGSGGGELLAKTYGVPLLAQIPLTQLMREAADEGDPIAIADPDGDIAKMFDELAEKVASLGPSRVYRSELSIS